MKKLLSTNDGIALVILIVAITITALIGAGITSFMASKKASEELPTYSYQAYKVADAGVDLMVRYIHDNKEDFTFNPPANYNKYIPQYDVMNNPLNLCRAVTINPTYWKQINLPPGFTKGDRGTLYVSLEGNCSSSCVLHSCGKYGAAVREIKLNEFQNYY